MKKVLIYSISIPSYEEAMALQEALSHNAAGDSVLYLSCDDKLQGCTRNSLLNASRCRMCSWMQKKRISKLLPENIEKKTLRDYFEASSERNIAELKFEYYSIADLKSITYRDVKIGYAALSSYISLTRNLDVVFDGEVKRYVDSLLLHQVRLTDTIIKVLEEFQPDCICFYNGRFPEYRPLLDLAQLYGIDYVVTENRRFAPNHVRRDIYYNSIPHDAEAYVAKYKQLWREFPNLDERERLARSFYENRRNAVFSGEKIYVKDQQKGLMPDKWNKDRENIVIFNTSEDEFCSINEQVDVERVFPTQMDGIKAIVEHYRNDINKYFWLRIHPNLSGIPFRYHQDLYKLDYPNLTVIPAESAISTYSLMDAASKVIVFGSTTGVEATYWGKPVICLGYSYYKQLGVVHTPKNVDELWPLIDNPNLPCLYNENVLVYGLHNMSAEQYNDNESFSMDYKIYNVFGKKLEIPMYRNYYFHSHLLTGLIELAGWKIGGWIDRKKEFKKIPM